MMIRSIRPVNNRRGDQRTLDVTLMMLLLAFFIVLTAMSVPSDTNRKAAFGSLAGAMGILPGGVSAFMGSGRDLTLKPGVILDERLNTAALVSRFEEQVLTDNQGSFVRTVVTRGGLEVMIENHILFAPGSAALSSSAQDFLKEVTFMLRRVKGNIRIESHTGSEKIMSARYGDNRGLSIARAGALVRYFISAGDIAERRFSLSGYGALRPLAIGGGAQKNDRTTILFKYIST